VYTGKGPPPPGFAELLILKVLKVLCFDALLQVFILKVVSRTGNWGSRFLVRNLGSHARPRLGQAGMRHSWLKVTGGVRADNWSNEGLKVRWSIVKNSGILRSAPIIVR
jgi:hypothetical protein